jgi:hypothetical protein
VPPPLPVTRENSSSIRSRLMLWLLRQAMLLLC